MIRPCGCCDHEGAYLPAMGGQWISAPWCSDCGAVLVETTDPERATPARWKLPRCRVPCIDEARYRGLLPDRQLGELDETQRAILAAMTPEGQAVLLRVLRLLRRRRSQSPTRGE